MRKQLQLLKELRKTAQADRILIPGRGGRKNRAWPVCITCGREPFSVNLEDVGKTKVEIRVKCAHKPYYLIEKDDRIYEEAATVDIPIGTERNEHIDWALKHLRWFDPAQVPK